MLSRRRLLIRRSRRSDCSSDPPASRSCSFRASLSSPTISRRKLIAVHIVKLEVSWEILDFVAIGQVPCHSSHPPQGDQSRNLDSVRKLKSAMTRLAARVQKVRDELEQLLDDDG